MIDDFPQYGDLWLHHSHNEAFLVCHTRDGRAYGQHILLDPDQPTTSEGKAIPIERLQGRYFLADRREDAVTA